MAGLLLEINDMDGLAFEGNVHGETARILREIADDVSNGKEQGVIHDLNGNSVGTWGMKLPEIN